MNDIDRAKQYLLERGWTKGDYSDRQGRVCLLGAFQLVYHTDTDVDFVTKYGQLFTSIINEQFPDRVDGRQVIYQFNDHDDTTLEDVLAVMDKAATRLEEQV